MTWDWWYGNKLFTVGGPLLTMALSVRFLVLGQIAACLCMLAVCAAEVAAWFYRWIEWREPAPRARIQEGLLAGANTSSASPAIGEASWPRDRTGQHLRLWHAPGMASK